MTFKIALAGNPNSGKTTLFNTLTGSNQYVGNWPGVTVEKKEGKLKKKKDVTIIDLPGIYSLSPYSLEEVVARDFLQTQKIDAIINIIDGSNLERNLYLTTQLLEVGVPVIIAVNMMDIVKKNGDAIKLEALSKMLGCPVVSLSALKGDGVDALIETAVQTAKSKKYAMQNIFTEEIEEIITKIESSLDSSIAQNQKRYYAIKLFERDKKIKNTITSLLNINEIIEEAEKKYDDDSESIITSGRYAYISSIIHDCYHKKNRQRLSTSDKIDRIVTNRWLSLPIFILIMWFVYYLSVSSLGKDMTDWINDSVFDEGWNFFGMHIAGLPDLVRDGLSSIGAASWLIGLICDGIIAGVGAVLGFVPEILVLFLMLAILESCGYMARIAFILDRIFRKFGLSGKSFIPILVGSGCGVPGIMASRTIENDQDRKMTIMTTTFIPCSAKLPIIALISGAIFNGASWVAPSAYFIGIAAIICSGIILKKTKLFAGDPAPFVMELPAYHLPTISGVLHSMWERGWSFIKKAGSVILLSTIFIWFTSNFGFVGGSFGMVEDLDDGLLSYIGKGIAWIFAPLGWGHWKATVSAITGLVAKENVVGTFGILYGFGDISENGNEIWKTVAAHFTTLSAFSYLIFNLLCAPCFAAVGAIKREMNNGKWTCFAVAYQTFLAYISAFVFYQIGLLVTKGTFNIATIIAIISILVFIYLLVRPNKPTEVNSEAVETAKV